MMAHCEGMLLEKTLLIFLFGILVWLCPLTCWCLSLTPLDLQGMQASQISDYSEDEFAFTADLAIDGNSQTDLTDLHCSHTEIDSHPWWKVDLGTNHCLGRVTLVKREDCCQERLIDAIVRAGIESDIFNNAACGSPVTSAQSTPGAHIQILCDPPVIARYVSVDDVDHLTHTENNVLALCEVMVEEYPMEECLQTKTTGLSTAAVIVDPSISITCMSTLKFVGKRITDPLPLLVGHMKSLVQCFLSCKMKTGCCSFDYVMTSGQCRLYDVKAGDLKTDDQPGCLVYAVVRG